MKAFLQNLSLGTFVFLLHRYIEEHSLFTCEVYVKEKLLGTGKSGTKKAAKEYACNNAMSVLNEFLPTLKKPTELAICL